MRLIFDFRRGAILAVCIFAAFGAALIAGCGSDQAPKKFESAGYSYKFDYPSDGLISRQVRPIIGAAGTQQIGVVIGPNDKIIVSRFRLKKKLRAGINVSKDEIDRVVAALTESSKGTSDEGKAVAFGGLPGYEYTIRSSAGGVQLQDKMTFLFRGRYEYLIDCQSSKDKRDKTNKACDQIRGSLQFK